MACISSYVGDAGANRLCNDVCVECCCNNHIYLNAVWHAQLKMENDVAHYDASRVRCVVMCLNVNNNIFILGDSSAVYES